MCRREHPQKFSKVGCAVTVHSEFSRELTFENFYKLARPNFAGVQAHELADAGLMMCDGLVRCQCCNAVVLGVAAGVSQCVALCCSVLPCVAVRSSVLRCDAECCREWQCVAVCCLAVCCLAVCCVAWASQMLVLQRIAACCSVVQCVAVCCICEHSQMWDS